MQQPPSLRGTCMLGLVPVWDKQCSSRAPGPTWQHRVPSKAGRAGSREACSRGTGPSTGDSGSIHLSGSRPAQGPPRTHYLSGHLLSFQRKHIFICQQAHVHFCISQATGEGAGSDNPQQFGTLQKCWPGGDGRTRRDKGHR